VLDLGFPETSQSLSLFKQLLFSSFHRGDQIKKLKNYESPPKSGSSFPSRDPLLKFPLYKIIICTKDKKNVLTIQWTPNSTFEKNVA
jgi:hypothetical protein